MMDDSKHNSTDILITIRDVNDNYPIFDQPEYNISINENIQVGSEILTVAAVDLDEVCDFIVTLCTSL